MSLKIDDWAGYGSCISDVLTNLYSLVHLYPIKVSENILTLGDVRSKIVLFNRICSNNLLGTPIMWSDNTSGEYATATSDRNYQLYVQDQYKELPNHRTHLFKLGLVIDTFNKKKQGEIVLNFASAVYFGINGVYIMGDLLSYFGEKSASERPKTFGWIMFDYQFEKYYTDTYGLVDIVSLVIFSNFNYLGFENKFNIISPIDL